MRGIMMSETIRSIYSLLQDLQRLRTVRLRRWAVKPLARQHAAEQLPQLGVVLGNENLEHGDPSVSVFSVYHRRPDFGTENFRFMN